MRRSICRLHGGFEGHQVKHPIADLRIRNELSALLQLRLEKAAAAHFPAVDEPNG